MNEVGLSIIECLRNVAAERELRARDPALAERVAAVKQFQHARFARTYADLLADARYAKAAAFFLEDLYGPADFTERDGQFLRVVPALVRLFPKDILATVSELGALHALSERLDTSMAKALPHPRPDGLGYAQAWRTVGEAPARERQIALMVAVGSALDRYTRNALLRQTLRVMRGPAQAAGLGALQQFLERGFDTFRGMGGAQEFLATISRRERALAALLFDGGEPAQGAAL